MSTEAEKRGLDKGPRFDEVMHFTRMQILSQELSRSLQEESGKVTDADIDDYYKKNELSYEQATFARIFIPKAKQTPTSPALPVAKAGASAPLKPTPPPPPPTEAQKKAAEEAMDKVAESIRARAAKGEDPDALQKEAYAAAGLPGSPMSTKMEKVRRTTLPMSHQKAMDLKPGEVSEVITDTNSGHYVYKLLSKENLSEDSVKPEIRNIISSQRYRDSMQGFQGNVDLSDAYFGSGKLVTPQRPKGAKPVAQEDEDPD
jgi:bifunctional DNA-binding transcriptional regulator/antitoxin component of YhaV-PrlF toxin-antitoxin module